MPWLIITLFTSSQEAKASGRRRQTQGEGLEVALLSPSPYHTAGCCRVLQGAAELGCVGAQDAMGCSGTSPVFSTLGTFPWYFRP